MKRKELSQSPQKGSPVRDSSICATDLNQNKMSRIGSSNVEKERKYDRQLRLWGDHGQSSLELANICLLHASATGTETLKCLILPGIGKYTIVDDAIVEEEDLGNNFFLDRSSLGGPRARHACELLQELNEDVRGRFFIQEPLQLLENDPEFFRQFTLVIGSRLSESALLKFGNFFWSAGIPFVVCDTFGFLGYIRLAVKEQTVIESHPDNALEDLRLDKPFQKLIDYMNQLDLDRMDKLEHSHTPYLVVIFKFLQKWKEQSNKQWPRSYMEKSALKELIMHGRRTNKDGFFEEEENFFEAVKNVNSVLVESKVPGNIQQIIGSNMCEHPSGFELARHTQNSKFWILARALKEFVNQSEGGMLPLRGSIPDMFSDTKRYIALQNIYKSKANEDAELMAEYVKEILDDLQLQEDFISKDEIGSFCRNAGFLHVTHGRSLHDEFRSGRSACDFSATIGPLLDLGADTYFLIRALRRFASENRRYPGESNSNCDDEVHQLKTIMKSIKKEYSLDGEGALNYVEEICRCRCRELHSVTSIIGGMTAQEVIKIITRQFVAVDNTLLYDGIKQSSVSIKL